MNPETSRPTALRSVIRWITSLSFAATVVLIGGAVAIRSLDTLHQALALSCLGGSIGGALIDFLMAAHRDRRWSFAGGCVALLVSFGCYLAIVWGWGTSPVLWRVWWISGLVALLAAHLGALAMIRISTTDWSDRAARPLSILAVLLLLGLGLRPLESLLAVPSPLYVWLMVALLVANVGVTIRAWRRFVAAKVPMAEVWRRSKVALCALLFCVTFSVGYYLGRVTSPPPNPADMFPSLLRGMTDQEVDDLVSNDYLQLKRIATAIDALADDADEYRVKIAKNMGERDFFTPEEDDEIRRLFMKYLAHRTALLRMLATYAGFKTVRDPDLQSRCFMVGYGAAVTVFENSLKLVNTFANDKHARRKLNEPEPRWGIRGQMFDHLYRHVTSQRNHDLCEEMAAYFDVHREEWRRAEVWPAEDFDWLSSRIARGVQYVRGHSVASHKAFFELLMTRVRSDAYSPVYACQSLVSEWIGDTRLAARRPLITVEQIDQIEKLLQPGDILLERRNWFLSNAFLPGFWPHAALYVGQASDLEALGIADRPEIRSRLAEFRKKAPDGHALTVIEAVSEGVIFNSLHHSMHADHVAVLRPRNLSPDQRGEAIARAFTHKGKPYDFEFDFFTSHRLVCTEVVYRAYEGMLHFELVKVMGRNTLPALEIARKFADERQSESPQLEFVLFLDGSNETGHAQLVSEEEFCASIDRSQAFNE